MRGRPRAYHGQLVAVSDHGAIIRVLESSCKLRISSEQSPFCSHAFVPRYVSMLGLKSPQSLIFGFVSINCNTYLSHMVQVVNIRSVGASPRRSPPLSTSVRWCQAAGCCASPQTPSRSGQGVSRSGDGTDWAYLYARRACSESVPVVVMQSLDGPPVLAGEKRRPSLIRA